MPDLRKAALLALAFALGTYAVGWWAVPVLGAVWGLVGSGSGRAGRTAALAAALGWAILLLWAGFQGPVLPLAGKLGQIFGVPGAVILLLTIAFPAVVGGSVGSLVAALRVSRDGEGESGTGNGER